jgi:hypothetical protein
MGGCLLTKSDCNGTVNQVCNAYRIVDGYQDATVCSLEQTKKRGGRGEKIIERMNTLEAKERTRKKLPGSALPP